MKPFLLLASAACLSGMAASPKAEAQNMPFRSSLHDAALREALGDSVLSLAQTAGTAEAVILDALDRKGPITRLGRTQVTVRTAALIERLHQRIKPVVPDNVLILAVPPVRRNGKALHSAVFSQNGMGHTGSLYA